MFRLWLQLFLILHNFKIFSAQDCRSLVNNNLIFYFKLILTPPKSSDSCKNYFVWIILNYFIAILWDAWPHPSEKNQHCVKSVCIQSYSGPYSPAFGLNMERYSVSLRIQSESGKMQTRITPNTDTFHAVPVFFICAAGVLSMCGN